ncbi:hypothetical protein [Actinophytocola gossypii]|uniref:DUF732 domain-containing protein n=1 Tax=Actinophytocola gossypii TaxID=2812003 RepID=A0ABT2J7H9_9PSEU|nr:hypothetical protein [Actinophytocola gossypii]MCT2583450.1 hypothetical protein [Actinophytocola gossypii]
MTSSLTGPTDKFSFPDPAHRPWTPPPPAGPAPIGTPIGAGGPPAPMGPRRSGVVLTVVAVVLVLTAGTFAGLYLATSGEHDDLADRLDDRRTELADRTDRATTTERERDRAEDRNSDLRVTRDALATCVDAVQHYLWDGLTGSARDAAISAMFTACE